MEPIDRPFRVTWDFCVAWALLTLPTLALVLSNQWDFGPWYSKIAFVIVVPFMATFFVYGPVLFIHQIIRSGSRGWFVARVFLAIFLVALLLFGGLYLSGFYTVGRARMLAFVFAGAATTFLSWRTGQR
ncbi:MAG TPA: hypothetical protein VK742_11650 [Candidatus Sulfotelmatobacter sp.]|nr:hypothetical protein [Candidatus Sulfotelmatobacter sp.]